MRGILRIYDARKFIVQMLQVSKQLDLFYSVEVTHPPHQYDPFSYVSKTTIDFKHLHSRFLELLSTHKGEIVGLRFDLLFCTFIYL